MWAQAGTNFASWLRHLGSPNPLPPGAPGGDGGGGGGDGGGGDGGGGGGGNQPPRTEEPSTPTGSLAGEVGTPEGSVTSSQVGTAQPTPSQVGTEEDAMEEKEGPGGGESKFGHKMQDDDQPEPTSNISRYRLALQDNQQETEGLLRSIQKVRDEIDAWWRRDGVEDNIERIQNASPPDREANLALAQLMLSWDINLNQLAGLRKEILETLGRLKGVLRKNLPEARMGSLVDEYASASQFQRIRTAKYIQDINTVYDMLRTELRLEPDGKEGRRFSQEVVPGSEEGEYEGKG
jgi:hypothetical protein